MAETLRTPSLEVTGRARLIEAVCVAVAKRQSRCPVEEMIPVGLRGARETVLVERIVLDAADRGIVVL